MTKLAIIGASHFQNPLILRAKKLGIETHVFAWEAGDVGEFSADVFHPISIIDKDAVLAQCRAIGIDGIASIGTDVGNITVAYVADKLGLVANSVECVARSTDKEAMRETFAACGDPSPKSMRVDARTDLASLPVAFPAIVKPADRSGSRGIAKVERARDLPPAVQRAIGESFSGVALIEEFVDGAEFSVEYLSWEGEHHFLALTEKFTTGAPRFIETGHLEPARVSPQVEEDIRRVVSHALDSLGARFGASHSEVKVDSRGEVKIIEIGTRMGGDCIGSDLVRLSSGYDFLEAVIDVALGRAPKLPEKLKRDCAAVRFVFSEDDVRALERLKREDGDLLTFESPLLAADHEIVDSSTRLGYFIMRSESLGRLERYLPVHDQESLRS